MPGCQGFFITVNPGLSRDWLHEPFLHHSDFHLDGLQCTVLIAVRVPQIRVSSFRRAAKGRNGAKF